MAASEPVSCVDGVVPVWIAPETVSCCNGVMLAWTASEPVRCGNVVVPASDLDRSLNCPGGGLPDIISLMQIYLPLLIQ